MTLKAADIDRDRAGKLHMFRELQQQTCSRSIIIV